MLLSIAMIIWSVFMFFLFTGIAWRSGRVFEITEESSVRGMILLMFLVSMIGTYLVGVLTGVWMAS